MIQCNRGEIIGSGLYVDVENVGADGQAIIDNLLDDWPINAPKPSRMALYVRADQVEMWRLWSTSRFPNMDVVVNGTQHFSMSSTKNSADISMAINAMSDLVLKRVSHVVVLSDDSDFISLYCAIRDEPEIPLLDGKPPFVWVVTGRAGSISQTLKLYFPPEQIYVASNKSKGSATATGASDSKQRDTLWEEVANAVVEEIPVGQFKSTDCQSIIKKLWPRHTMAKAAGPQFGTEFKNNVWPALEKMGVQISNPGKKPVKYEMTTEAKDALG